MGTIKLAGSISGYSLGTTFLRLIDLPRYWHTLKYLKPIQFYGRLGFRLARPRPDLSPSPDIREASGAWRLPAHREPSMAGARSFLFFNIAGDLDDIGWEGPQREKLWRYHQHYFDDLNARDAVDRSVWHAALIEDWLAANPPGAGTGWEPYPTSLRIVNWIKWSLAGHPLSEGTRHSLAVQIRWLGRRLEWHLLGNHLFVNAKALVFAGCFFVGSEAAAWRDRGLAILVEQIPEQILADGGQFERSPMYHALALEDLLDLINLFHAFPDALPDAHRRLIEGWPSLAERMLEWLRVMCHPDGGISLFNDAALGVAPDLAELTRYATALSVLPAATLPPPAEGEIEGSKGPPDRYDASCRSGDFGECATLIHPTGLFKPVNATTPPFTPLPAGEGPGVRGLAIQHLRESGYLRLEGDDAVALLDVAPIGPDYLPGHAHADTLSFELSLSGQRVVVNGGTSRYGLGSERLRERGTRSHSTVEVACADSSEVWGGFRVARRAYPFDLRVASYGDDVTVACAHDGYRRLPGRPVHSREWRLSPGRLLIQDRVTGGLPAVARFLLHPEVSIEVTESDGWRLRLPSGRTVRTAVREGRAVLESACYAPAFGQVLSCHCLRVDLVNGRSSVELSWWLHE